MRLNQLAKKVGKPYTRVEKYIRKDLNIDGIEGPNSRVDEEIVNKVISKFGLFKQDVKDEPKIKLQTVEAKPAEISPEDRGLEDINLDYAIPAESVVPNLDGLGEEKIQEVQIDQLDKADANKTEGNSSLDVEESSTQVTEKVESSERLISETLETEETVLHIDQEGTIVAPKVELEGIKVRGKIDIPGITDQTEDQNEEAAEEIELTAEEIDQLKQEEAKKIKAAEDAAEAKRKKIDSDAAKALAFKEKKAKEEKEALRLQIEKEKQKKKEVGKKHYLDTVKHSPKANKSKKKKVVVLEQEVEKNKAFETKEKYASTDNMTTWQKLVRWFNT